MFGIVDMIIVAAVSMIGTSFICLFIAGANALNRIEDAYQEGYDKGYADGKRVGGESE